MNLLKLIMNQHRWAFVRMLLLTLASGILGIGVLMFINTRLMTLQDNLLGVLWQFVALLAVYLILATLAQISLTTLGHKCVYELRKQILKQIMDTDLARIQHLGKPKIMASLANDIQGITHAFVRLPELIQGGVFILCAGVYLGYLSPSLLAVTCIWIAATLLGGHWTVLRVYEHLKHLRDKENRLYQHYESALDGHKELSLNRYRAERFYDEEFDSNAQEHRHHIIRADNHHAFANNWTNVMMLGAVGFIFYLAIFHQWASIQDATTIALTVLFARTPLISAVGAFPTFVQGRVSLKALTDLGLQPFQSAFHPARSLPHDWQAIHLKNVTYAYKNETSGFALAPLNFSLQRGETVFLIGKNGSGKSTLSMLLSGLYQPNSGEILVDTQKIDPETLPSYRQMFSSVFTDFHLFNHLLDGWGKDASDELIQEWLHQLQMQNKAEIAEKRLLNTNLSQGQRKRLALLIAALEQRSVLILDEWAADQDPYFRKTFYEQLLPILKAQGHTIFAISHDDKYFHHADRIIQMDQGVL